jgi:hypothetical protein
VRPSLVAADWRTYPSLTIVTPAQVVRFADNAAQKTVREEAARAKRMSPLMDSNYSPNSQWGSPQT